VADFDVEVGVVVVVVVASDDDDVPSLEDLVGVVEDVEPSLDEVVAVALVAALLAPVCSLATTTPIRAVDAVAAITTERVMRRRRTLAR
jgi:predicted xylose isomerase-like sugar epimerase